MSIILILEVFKKVYGSENMAKKKSTMQKEDSILDFEKQTNSPELYLASSGTRLANYFIDRVFLYILLFIEMTGMDLVEREADGTGGIWILLFLLSIPGYWIFFEYGFGKTPAKFITKTKVVSINGKKPNLGQVMGRTFCRFIPFEPFSFLGSKAVGWHDKLPETRVVNDSFGNWEDEFV